MRIRYLGVLTVLTVLGACGGQEEAGSSAASEAGERSAEVASRSKKKAAGSNPIDVKIDQCTFTERAQIYGRPAAQWRAEHSGDPSVNVTVWRMQADGAHQINLYVQQGDETSRMNTVEGSSMEGSGTVTVTPQENGVRFEIVGEDQSGNGLYATISCAKLVEPVAEGG